MVLKNRVFIHNLIIITLTKLITEFIHVLVILQFSISKLNSFVKLFIIMYL